MSTPQADQEGFPGGKSCLLDSTQRHTTMHSPGADGRQCQTPTKRITLKDKCVCSSAHTDSLQSCIINPSNVCLQSVLKTFLERIGSC